MRISKLVLDRLVEYGSNCANVDDSSYRRTVYNSVFHMISEIDKEFLDENDIESFKLDLGIRITEIKDAFIFGMGAYYSCDLSVASRLCVYLSILKTLEDSFDF